jgi:starch phosphorylase
MSASRFQLEAQPRIPEALERLTTLASDLFYSWDHGVREIFIRLDPDLWQKVGHNPTLFLRRVAQDKLEAAAADRAYMAQYRKALAAYDGYLETSPHAEITDHLDPEKDLVAYFCAEFGFHESFPIYSGGLGILAGDHCKAASDLGVPFVAVGLLYQQGYFIQTIDADGGQVARYHSHQSDELPISPVEVDGRPLEVDVPFPDRTVHARVWKAKAGHITLYLLDTNTESNTEADRSITLQLYGGDQETRIQQELVLGIGGPRALWKLNYAPTVWHINEGHSSFQILERCHRQVESGLDFAAAVETVASATLFTTHTPVPAGHDIFPRELAERYLIRVAESLGVTFDDLFRLGMTPSGDAFNMTTLGLRGSRFHNGVSRIHGLEASRMEGGIWPQVPPEENPLDYITNGVHVPTFLAPEWASLFDMHAPTWRSALRDPDFWSFVDRIPEYHYWSVHKTLKQQMYNYIRRSLTRQHRRNGTSHAITQRMTAGIDRPERDALVIGFARRFATYKRATLLFSDIKRLERLVNDEERPVIIVFAGKAHPKDKPGQELIKVIHDLSQHPALIGKVLLLEDYDQAMARRLLCGVDVWLNTPEYPLEASGTSGEKAAVNGALNLSVLDGWWGEGYNGHNGWAISPRDVTFSKEFRNREEARDLLDILEYQVIPTYYDREGTDYSDEWITLSKASMKSITPRFNAQRMVMDYMRKFYGPASLQHARLSADDYRLAKTLAQWKQHVAHCWKGVTIKVTGDVPTRCAFDEPVSYHVEVFLNGLAQEDVRVECLVDKEPVEGDEPARPQSLLMEAEASERGVTRFSLTLTPPFPGVQSLRIRMYPYHPALSHPLELGCMLWA